MVCHQTSAPPQHHPSQKRTDEGIAQADPSGGNAEIPTEFTGIPNENHCREIGCAKGEGCQPRSGFVSAKHKTVYALGVLSAIKAHCEHQGKKQC